MWVVLAFCLGIFVDRSFPEPVNFLIENLQAAWRKVFKKSDSSPVDS